MLSGYSRSPAEHKHAPPSGCDEWVVAGGLHRCQAAETKPRFRLSPTTQRVTPRRDQDHAGSVSENLPISRKNARNLLLPHPFEGYKATCPARRKKSDEPPPHHSRSGRGVHNPHPRHWRRLGTRRLTARSAATRRPDTALDQRQRGGRDHSDSEHGHVAGEVLEVRVPVASV